jgi:hypothetical protein
MATRLHGRNGLVYMQGQDAQQAQVLTNAADWTLVIDHDVVNVGVMGDQWQYALRGINKWSGDLTGTLDPGSSLPWDAALAQTPRKFYIYPDTINMGVGAYYYGTIWPKLTVKGGWNVALTFNGTYEGDGVLGKAP